MVKRRSLFQVIDFDRVLFDTEKFVYALTDALSATHPRVAKKLQESFDEAYAREETFFLLRSLRTMMGGKFIDFVNSVITAHGGGEAFLLPGASERLEFARSLSTEQPSIGILTFGDEIDQLMKINIAGLTGVPVLISPTPNKAEVLRSWKQANGTFRLPSEFGGHDVDTLTLEDDKRRAFENLPSGVYGIWVNGEQSENLPLDTIQVSTLQESMEFLRATFL